MKKMIVAVSLAMFSLASVGAAWACDCGKNKCPSECSGKGCTSACAPKDDGHKDKKESPKK